MRKVHILIIFPQNKDLIVRTNIRVQDLTSGENLPLSFPFVLPEKRLNRDIQLIAILRRQFCIILTALEENIFSVLGGVAKRRRPIRNIFSSN